MPILFSLSRVLWLTYYSSRRLDTYSNLRPILVLTTLAKSCVVKSLDALMAVRAACMLRYVGCFFGAEFEEGKVDKKRDNRVRIQLL